MNKLPPDTTYPSHLFEKEVAGHKGEWLETSPNYLADLAGLLKGLFFTGDPNDVIRLIDANLEKNYNYSKPEQDALRHYLGMQSLAEHYGPNAAKLFGDMNERTDIFGSPGGIQSEIDIKNNKKALEDYWANKQLKEYDKSILDSLLKEIIIPPETEGVKRLKESLEIPFTAPGL